MKKHFLRLVSTLATLLCITSCAASAVPSEPQTNETIATTSSCTGHGAHLIRMSIPYPDPLLPAPADGTTAPGFSIITMDSGANPALVSIVGHSPKFPNEEFNAKELGNEISYAGHTVRITSICEGGARFDLVAQPESSMSLSNSCTGSGAYRIVPSVNGSTPALPLSGQGREFTPRVGLAGTKADATPPTADISIAAEAPDPTPVFFNGMQLRSEATANGYTIRITSICDKEVLFDLVRQPDEATVAR